MPKSEAQSSADPKLRLMIFAPALAAAMIPFAASAHVISSGSPIDTMGAPGKIPKTPKPLNDAAAADATIVPCGPSTGPGLSWRVFAARSGCVVSTRSSMTAIDTAPGAGGVIPGSTTRPRA